MNIAVYARRYFHPVAAVIIQSKMVFAGDDQIHIPENPTIKSKVSSLRVDFAIPAVVDVDHKVIFPCHTQMLRDVHPKPRITALMSEEFPTIKIDFRGHRHAVKFEICGFIFGDVDFYFFIINASPTIIIIAPVLAVNIVPGMRQINSFHLSGINICQGQIIF